MSRTQSVTGVYSPDSQYDNNKDDNNSTETLSKIDCSQRQAHSHDPQTSLSTPPPTPKTPRKCTTSTISDNITQRSHLLPNPHLHLTADTIADPKDIDTIAAARGDVSESPQLPLHPLQLLLDPSLLPRCSSTDTDERESSEEHGTLEGSLGGPHSIVGEKRTRVGGGESRSSSSTRVSRAGGLRATGRDVTKGPPPVNERPRWVGAWSSLATWKDLNKNDTKNKIPTMMPADRRQSITTLSRPSTPTSPSTTARPSKVPFSPGLSGAAARRISLQPNHLNHRGEADNNKPSGHARGRSDSIASNTGRPLSTLNPTNNKGNNSNSRKGNITSTNKDGLRPKMLSSQISASSKERQGPAKSTNSSAGIDFIVQAPVVQRAESSQENNNNTNTIHENRMKSCATSNADAQSSPALIRRFLFSTTTAASSSDVASTTTQSTSEEARTSSDASFNTVEAASKMHNLTAPMAVVASFVANATFDHPQQYAYSDSSSSSSLHRRRDYGSAASSIAFADDAMSSMSSMTAGEMAARESQPAHAPGYPSSSASSITAPTSPSTSSAHQAFSKIMEQNDRQRSVFDVLASKTRLYLSSGRDSNTIEEGQLRSGRRESSYKTTSPVTPEKRSRLPMELAASESDASSLYHVRVSSIESFPKHVMSNSSAPTMQYLRGLFRRASVSGAESTVAARVPADGTDSKAVNS